MTYVTLQKSNRKQPIGARRLKESGPDETIHVTVVVRSASTKRARRDAIKDLASQLPHIRKHLNLREFTKLHGARDEDLSQIKRFAKVVGLRVVQTSKVRRCVVLSGTVSKFSRIFKVKFKNYIHAGHVYRSYGDVIQIPAHLKGIIEAVLGLENRLLMTHHTFMPGHHAIEHVDPQQIIRTYNFPTDADGKGECIAIIELGGGFYNKDINEYFTTHRLQKPKIKVIEIDGQKNNPAAPDSIEKVLELIGVSHEQKGTVSNLNQSELVHAMWTIESTLDIQLAGSFANAANIVVYFAPNNAQGKYHALTSAITNTKHKPTLISCSWGAVEVELPLDLVHTMDQIFQDAALRGITVCFSSGDKGDDPDKHGKPRAHFPASSPHVLSCGGTHWKKKHREMKEVVWSEALPKYVVQSGGGVSSIFKEPEWQATAGVKSKTGKFGRGIPDVSGKADIEGGYCMRVGGFNVTMGGTSAAAPMWAGLIARLNQKLGCRMGYVTPLLYKKNFRQTFRDITKGSNGTHFKAGPGWDACTGWGTPNGKKLLAALKRNS